MAHACLEFLGTLTAGGGWNPAPPRVGLEPAGASVDALPVLELEREPGEPLDDSAVERCLVLLVVTVCERPGVMIAQIGQRLGSLLDEIDVLAVPLLGFVSFGAVIGSFRSVAVADQPRVIPLEEVELSGDHVGEPAAPKHAPRLAAF